MKHPANFKDLTGKTFGKLYVISYANTTKQRSNWNVRCECGTEFVVRGSALTTANTKGCGNCYQRQIGKFNIPNMINQVFSRLTVLELDTSKAKRVHWICKCSCGKIVSVCTSDLKNGNTQSCGCLHYERLRNSVTKHGMSETSEYNIWLTMQARCDNPKTQSYKYYGGRGIKVCAGYRDGFENFFNDVGSKPSKKHSIDRIDTDLHYSCGKCEECINNVWGMNVQWGTEVEQARNKTNTKWFDLNGKKVKGIELAESLSVSPDTLYPYIKKHSVNKAIEHYSKPNWNRLKRYSLQN